LPTALLATVLQFASTALSADTASWKSRNIYFALTDRVARSSSDSGGGSCGNLGNYCGGTFAGIQSKLDYIQGMGFDAIWLTPVVASMFLWLEWNLCIGVVANVVLIIRYPWRISWLLGLESVCHQPQLRDGPRPEESCYCCSPEGIHSQPLLGLRGD
jgi:hypothetical protein